MSDLNNEPGDPEHAPPSFPPGQPSAASSPERAVSCATVTVVVGVSALLIGGVGGYLLNDGLSRWDVTASGQISYACAIVEKVRDDHRNEDDWGGFGEDEAYNDAGAISSLLGAFVPLVDPEEGTYPPLGGDIMQALQNGGLDDLNAALKAIQNECESR